jgi:hypothetical protein
MYGAKNKIKSKQQNISKNSSIESNGIRVLYDFKGFQSKISCKKNQLKIFGKILVKMNFANIFDA